MANAPYIPVYYNPNLGLKTQQTPEYRHKSRDVVRSKREKKSRTIASMIKNNKESLERIATIDQSKQDEDGKVVVETPFNASQSISKTHRDRHSFDPTKSTIDDL